MWWLLIGVPATNQLLRIKRLPLQTSESKVLLDFAVPKKDKEKLSVSVFLISDSWIGVDQEHHLELTVE